jgi:hypothetical protein
MREAVAYREGSGRTRLRTEHGRGISKLGLGQSGPELTGEPLDHFRRFYNDAISNSSPDAVRMAMDFFGPDHIMFGTDFPFGPSDGERWPLDELRNIKTMPLDDAVRDKILYRNATEAVEAPRNRPLPLGVYPAGKRSDL